MGAQMKRKLPSPPLRALTALAASLAVSVLALNPACSSDSPPPAQHGGPKGAGGASHTDGGPGNSPGAATLPDGGAVPGADASVPFEAVSPAVYVAKVKNILVGLPPTDDEGKAATAGPTARAGPLD